VILSPTISLTLGNLRYDQHVSRVSASLTTLPGVNSATVDLPAGVRFEAATGEDAILALDGGEGAHDVMTGTIHRIDRTPTRIRVMLADAGATLASLRVASTFKGLGAAEIVKAIASDADVEVGEMSMDLDAALYVADQRRTAAEHVAALCRMGGLFACVGGDGKLSGIAADSDTATIAIKYGREIIEVSSTSRRVPAAPADDERAVGLGGWIGFVAALVRARAGWRARCRGECTVDSRGGVAHAERGAGCFGRGNRSDAGSRKHAESHVFSAACAAARRCCGDSGSARAARKRRVDRDAHAPQCRTGRRADGVRGTACGSGV